MISSVTPRSKSLINLFANCMIAIAFFISAIDSVAATPVVFNNHNYDTGARSSVVADMNGDGHPDIVSASASVVNVLLNDGTGNFLNPGNNYAPVVSTGETELAICSVAVGDLNGDGKLDVAAADCGSGVVHIFTNDGSGRLTFLKDLGPVGGSASSVVIADINGDGLLDVAATGTGNVQVFFNQGGANFTAPSVVAVATDQSLSSLTAGDINADGKVDFALLANAYTANAKVYQLINQTSKGSLTASFASTLIETGTGRSVKLVDIDKDGHADLLITYGPAYGCSTPCNSSGLTWIFNNPNGSRTKSGYNFVSPGIFYLNGEGATAADFNGDGLNDIALAVSSNRGESANQVRYFLGTGPRSFSAAQPSEVGGLRSNWGIVSADLNGDHQSDLVAFNLGAGGDDVKYAILGNPGWGVGASEFCAPPAPGIWNICSPKANQVIGTSAATLFFDGVVTAPSGQSVLSTSAFIDGQLYDTSSNRGLIGRQNVGSGPHSIRFHALLSGGGSLDKTVSFQAGGTAACTPPPAGTVKICSPPPNLSIPNPVNFAALAAAPSGQRITAMKLYIDSVAKYSSSSSSLNTSLSLPTGVHKVTVNAWTNTGLVEKSSETFTVE